MIWQKLILLCKERSVAAEIAHWGMLSAVTVALTLVFQLLSLVKR